MSSQYLKGRVLGVAEDAAATAIVCKMAAPVAIFAYALARAVLVRRHIQPLAYL